MSFIRTFGITTVNQHGMQGPLTAQYAGIQELEYVFRQSEIARGQSKSERPRTVCESDY